MNPSALDASGLVSELTAEAVRGSVGSLGLLVRDVPEPDAGHLLQRLNHLREAEGLDLRVAYLREGGEESIEKMALDKAVFSHEIERAEGWRNERALAALIVVIAHGDEAKLSSLAEFTTVTSRDLKRTLVNRAIGEEAGKTEVQARWWALLGEDEGIGLGQIIDYYLALSGKMGNEFAKASGREIYRLGLLPDANLFDDPKEMSIRARLQANKDLTRRLQMLTPQDRRRVSESIFEEGDLQKREQLREGLDQLYRIRWDGEGMKGLSFGQAERLLRARRKKKTNGTKTVSEKASEVAAGALLDEGPVDRLKSVLGDIEKELDEIDETELRPRTTRTTATDGSPETVAVVRPDIINFMKRLLDDGVYGGLVRIAESPNLEDALRRFNPESHLIVRWPRERVLEFLDYFSEIPAGKELATRFEVYNQARTVALPMLGVLATEPLLAVARSDTRAKIEDLVDKYEALINVANEGYGDLSDKYGAEVNDALANLILMDTVIVEAGNKVYCLLAPTHPLYLWHYAKYSRVVSEQRDRFDERDGELVVEAAAHLPNFLTALYVPPVVFGTGRSLTYLGRLGSLPYFGERAESSVVEDGVREIRSVIEAQLALEPYARYGFRLALVDPPNAGTYLTLLADLARDGLLLGAHLIVYRHPEGGKGVELRLDEDQEDGATSTFRALAPGRRFTFEVRTLPEQAIGPENAESFHSVIVFDQSRGKVNQVQPANHLLQPLALPRRLRYSIGTKLVELEPSSGGPFGAYYAVVDRLPAGGGPSYVSTHQDSSLRASLQSLAERCAWTLVADRHVDRDLSLGTIRVSTGRDGERDVAAFSKDTAAFRRPLRDVVRNYNAFIDDEELDDLLRHLSNTLDSGLLTLKPDRSGKTDYNRVKGLLGTLIAVRWFRSSATKPRLMISLDSPEARRWLHLRHDNLRADLLCFEWEDDHCVVKVIEVKAVQDSKREYVVKDGSVTGDAVQQVLATRRLLEQIFGSDRADELITTPARREILREHLYRELAKDHYSQGDRRLWAERLQKTLDGDAKARITCHLVEVRLGVDTSALESRTVAAHENGTTVPIYISQLNHESLEELTPQETNELEKGPVEEERRTSVPTRTTSPDVPRAEDLDGATNEEEAADGPPGARAEERPPTARGGEENPPDERARALLGTSPGAYGTPREVWFDPYLPTQELPNPHVSITGETGSGKTQATKALVKDLGERGIRPLALDFKDDYSERAYAEAENLTVYDPNLGSLPFNPLAPPVDPVSGKANPTFHIHQFSSILKRVYKLGDQQAYKLREAVKRTYAERGVPAAAFEPSPTQAYPAFEEVRAHLEAEKGNEALLGRMSPIFDLGLFAGTEKAEFATVVGEGTVIRLGQLPGDETKNSVAELFLMALYNHLIRQPHARRLSRLLVLDEAWRLVESPFLEPLIREGRAFGLGVLVATQFPSDIPEEISGNTATKLFFSQTQQKQIREIQRTVVGKTSGADADNLAAVCRDLAPLSCVLHSKQYPPYARVRIKPYFER